MDYELEQYSVDFGMGNNLIHGFYVRTTNPPALIHLLILSRNGMCDDFSFSLIEEELEVD